ncbi:uncharacterized protein LOC113865154 [Abrus precatorius]|uniref:Uncharacterized protein LOC113865154 n=1 Tax=Abrus precatorius TaxID=3816 RepID=A0A8B8LKJ4_ABRPR|nr:uncharacterized protein LOC113865154 [Abrus precatorius]
MVYVVSLFMFTTLCVLRLFWGVGVAMAYDSPAVNFGLNLRLKMILSKGIASIIVIIVLIPPEIAAQVVSPGGTDADNVSEFTRHKENTIRVDPLDNFKKYKGGFSITNKHYWSSVIFTGVYGYAIGVLWLLCGLFLLTINFCCQSDGGRCIKKIISCNIKICDLSPIRLAILLMVLAMAASGLVLVGSSKFHSHLSTSVNIIVKTSNNASQIIHNATLVLEEIRHELVDSNISAEAAAILNSTIEKSDTAAENIVKKTRKNRRIIDMAFKVYNDYCGHKLEFGGSNSFISFWSTEVLEGTLPICYSMLVDNSDLLATLWIVNSGISNLPGTLFQNHVYICNPFSAPPEYLYQPENCPPNSTQIGDIPNVLKPYTCFDDNVEKCGSENFISGSEYEVIESYTRTIQNLLSIYPSMEQLVGSQLVKDAFSQVLKHCKPLKKFAPMAWVGMVFLAVIMMFSVVLWTIKACHEHNDNHTGNGSVQLHYTARDA